MHNLLEPGQLLCDDQYRVESFIGRGGMGAVYKALDLRKECFVAIKVLLQQNSAALQRFIEEARLLALVSHRAIVDVYNFYPDDPAGPLLITEFLEGQDLSKVLRQPLPTEDAVALILAVCSGLYACHRRNVIHRDIKPSNVFLVEGSDWQARVRLIDFGLAFGREMPAPIFARGARVPGTARWQAPELLCQHAPTPLSDQYAVAALLYTALAGRDPYSEYHGEALRAAILSGNYRPLESIVPGLHPSLVQLVNKGLSFEPTNRFADLNVLAMALVDHAPAGSRAGWRHHFAISARPIDHRLYEPVSAPTSGSPVSLSLSPTSVVPLPVKNVPARQMPSPPRIPPRRSRRHVGGNTFAFGVVVGSVLGSLTTLAVIYLLLAARQGIAAKRTDGETLIRPTVNGAAAAVQAPAPRPAP